jgi:[acyl-carrier-protein] S-malonyltransferase
MVVDTDARRLAFVFPGQGSQKVGMGGEWSDLSPAARRTFEEADEVLGFGLSELIRGGPEEELSLTANTQPALLTVSVAIHRTLRHTPLRPAMVAGHSLGEYSALVAGEVLSFADALRLVRRRGELMQEAVPAGVGAMAAVLALDPEEVAEVARQAQDDVGEVADETGRRQPAVCTVANYNSPVQTVLAGHRAVVERAIELARERGARRVVKLPVSAPFHCPLMRPAREAMAELLAETRFGTPTVPVVTNVDARGIGSGDEAREALIRQIDSPVRWTESVAWMAGEGGVEVFVEMGAGTVLTGLVRRIVQGVETAALETPGRARELLAGYGIDLEALRS